MQALNDLNALKRISVLDHLKMSVPGTVYNVMGTVKKCEIESLQRGRSFAMKYYFY